jgi:hypothetical protein
VRYFRITVRGEPWRSWVSVSQPDIRTLTTASCLFKIALHAGRNSHRSGLIKTSTPAEHGGVCFCTPLPPDFFGLTISGPQHSVPSNWGFQMSVRLRAALFAMIAVAVVSVLPKIDRPETAFDETDAPTVQAVVMTEDASSKYISSEAASAPIPFARTCNAQVRVMFPYTNQSSDSRQLREPLSTLRC